METEAATVPELDPEGGLAGADEPHESDVAIDAVELLLDQVEAALSRLDDGTYGQCVTCGSPVEDPRLAEVPTALTCTACDAPAPPESPDS